MDFLVKGDEVSGIALANALKPPCPFMFLTAANMSLTARSCHARPPESGRAHLRGERQWRWQGWQQISPGGGCRSRSGCWGLCWRGYWNCRRSHCSWRDCRCNSRRDYRYHCRCGRRCGRRCGCWLCCSWCRDRYWSCQGHISWRDGHCSSCKSIPQGSGLARTSLQILLLRPVHSTYARCVFYCSRGEAQAKTLQGVHVQILRAMGDTRCRHWGWSSGGCRRGVTAAPAQTPAPVQQ